MATGDWVNREPGLHYDVDSGQWVWHSIALQEFARYPGGMVEAVANNGTTAATATSPRCLGIGRRLAFGTLGTLGQQHQQQ